MTRNNLDKIYSKGFKIRTVVLVGSTGRDIPDYIVHLLCRPSQPQLRARSNVIITSQSTTTTTTDTTTTRKLSIYSDFRARGQYKFTIMSPVMYHVLLCIWAVKITDLSQPTVLCQLILVPCTTLKVKFFKQNGLNLTHSCIQLIMSSSLGFHVMSLFLCVI